MAPKGIKASKVLKDRFKAKAVNWITQDHSRGTRDIPVKVRTKKQKTTQRQNTGGIESAEEILHGTNLPSMDVDETFWTEEPDIGQQKRVSSPASPPWVVFYESFSLNVSTSRNSFLR